MIPNVREQKPNQSHHQEAPMTISRSLPPVCGVKNALIINISELEKSILASRRGSSRQQSKTWRGMGRRSYLKGRSVCRNVPCTGILSAGVNMKGVLL